MRSACFALLVIIFITVVVLWARGQKALALSVAPMLILPAVHVYGEMLLRLLCVDDGLVTTLGLILDAIAAAATVILLRLVTTKKLRSEKTRRTINIYCTGYILVLFIVFISRLIW